MKKLILKAALLGLSFLAMRKARETVKSGKKLIGSLIPGH